MKEVEEIKGKSKVSKPVFKDGKVLRFSLVARLIHAVHLLSFFTLLYTGVARLRPETHVLLSGDLLLGQTIHHIAAVIFVVIPVAAMLVFGRGTGRFMKTILTWDKNDSAWMRRFLKWMLRPRSVKLPPQGKEKAGQKVSAWFIIGFAVVISASGMMMWAAQDLPADIVRWTYIVHDLCTAALVFIVAMHLYMGLLFPATRRSWTSMVTGYVPEIEAKSGWSRWYNELKKEAKELN